MRTEYLHKKWFATHLEDINRLIHEVEFILRSDDHEKNNRQIISRLEAAYTKEENNYRKSFFGISRTREDFEKRLNRNDNQYCYPRLLRNILAPCIAPHELDETIKSDIFRTKTLSTKVKKELFLKHNGQFVRKNNLRIRLSHSLQNNFFVEQSNGITLKNIIQKKIPLDNDMIISIFSDLLTQANELVSKKGSILNDVNLNNTVYDSAKQKAIMKCKPIGYDQILAGSMHNRSLNAGSLIDKEMISQIGEVMVQLIMGSTKHFVFNVDELTSFENKIKERGLNPLFASLIFLMLSPQVKKRPSVEETLNTFQKICMADKENLLDR